MDHIAKLTSFVKPYWKRAALALVLLTSLVFADLSIPRLIQRIIDQGISKHNQPLVIQTALLMIGISLVSMLIAVGNNIFSVQVGESVARDLRQAIFLKIQTFSFGNLDRQKTGQLMVRLTSDVNALKSLTQITLRIGTRGPLLMVGSLILMINTSPDLALTMLPLLLVTSAVIVFFIVKMEPLFLTVQQKLDRLNTVLQENIAGARLVKAFVRADFEAQRFEAANEDFTERSVRVMEFMATMSPVLTVCVNIGMVIVIWAGGLQAIRGGLSIGQIVAFTNYLLTTMTPLTMMAMLSNTWASGIASAQRVNEVLETSARSRRTPRMRVPCRRTPAAGSSSKMSASTTMGRATKPCCEQINLIAEPGQTVAILGATGAGKSTPGQPGAALLRCLDGQDPDRRDRRPPAPAGLAAGRRSASCPRRRSCSPGRCATTSATAARRPATRRSSPRPRRPRRTTSSWNCRRATKRTSSSAAPTSPAGRSSAWPSPAPCSCSRRS